MDVNQFIGIGIVGIVASLIIEAITRLSATNPLTSKFVAVGVSLVLGTGYYFAAQTIWWPTVVAVLAVASTVYSLFFNKNASVPTPPVA